MPTRPRGPGRAPRSRRLGPAGVLATLKASRLAGRGGANFPAATKWEAVAQHPSRPHYVVVNADESETGTFKDRILVEWDPFAVLEGAAIAAYACGADRVFIYIRGEYRHGYDRLLAAIREVDRGNAFGEALGNDTRLSFELRRGAGAYICGEETALLNSIEGKRGEPRSKPPFPVHYGLFGQPTVINNVETLACVPVILAEGADAFRALGTADSPGTKLFAVSGHIRRPGVYEIPSGTTIRALLDLAGGVPAGRQLQAIQCGGAAATMLSAEDLDLPLSAEGLRPRGATVGSGAIVVLDETADILDVIRRGAEFFAHESCGQCVPCRIGTQRQVDSSRGSRTARTSPDPGRSRQGDARRLHLRTRADRREHGPVRAPPARTAMTGFVALTIDGREVSVAPDSTILAACERLGIDTPTLCWGQTLIPQNACRVCVVELEGARVLVPACQRRVEAGMRIQTDSDRVRHSRKLVLEFLGSSVDVSTAPTLQGYLERYGGRPERFAGGRTVATPPKLDNEAYVRDYAKCTSATSASRRAGPSGRTPSPSRWPGGVRRPDRHGVRGAPPRFRVRLLRQLHRRVPDGGARRPG